MWSGEGAKECRLLEPGEIPLKRAEQSTILDYEGVKYSADRAIDGDLSTQSRTGPTYNPKWLKVYFNDTIGVRVGKVFVKKAYGHAACEYSVYVLNNYTEGKTPSGCCGKYNASQIYNITVGCEGKNGTGVMIKMSGSNTCYLNSLKMSLRYKFLKKKVRTYYFTSKLLVL